MVRAVDPRAGRRPFADVRGLPWWARTLAGACIGHGIGAVIGVVLVAGPATRLSTAVGLALVHVVADLGAGFGALAGSPNRVQRPTRAVLTVSAAGALASAAVLWPLGAAPTWLVLRAAVVVVVAMLVAARRPRVRS